MTISVRTLSAMDRAVAAGWRGAMIEEMKLIPVLENDVLRFDPDERGRTTKVVVDIDAADFTDRWFGAVERARS